MRYDKILILVHKLIIKNNVKIQCSRSPVNDTLPVSVLLDLMQFLP